MKILQSNNKLKSKCKGLMYDHPQSYLFSLYYDGLLLFYVLFFLCPPFWDF